MATLNRDHVGYVNPLEYGASCNSTTLGATLSVIGSTTSILMLTATDRAGSPATWSLTSNVTIPANVTLLVAGGAMLSIATGVTVTSYATIQAPRVQWITLVGTGALVLAGTPEVLPEWFGALADNSTNSTTGLRAAIASLVSGASLVCSPGTYLVDSPLYCTTSGVTITGSGAGAIIKASNSATIAHGVLTIGYTGAATVAVSDIEVTRLTLDANSKGRAIFCISTTRGRFHHNTFKNGYAGVTYFSVITDCEISHNYITGGGAGTQYGDGIYTEFASEVQILYNRIHSFRRIGIVVEGDGTTKSTNPLIQGNTITHAVTSTSPEYNAGIWIENTNGARILGNLVKDLYNSPIAAVAGIVISVGTNQTDAMFVIKDNIIADVDYGIWLNSTSVHTVCKVEGNTIFAGGYHTSYKAAVYITDGGDISITNNNFGENTHVADAEGGVLVNAAGDIFQLTLENNQTANVTHATGTGVLNVYAMNGHTLTYLNLINQLGRVIMWDTCQHMDVRGCRLTGNNTSYYSFAATNSLRMVDTEYTGTGTLTYSIQPFPSGFYQFVNCRLTLGLAVSAASSTPFYMSFTNCYFGTGSHIDMNSAAYLSFTQCTMNEYRSYANGSFLYGNGGNYTWHLRFQDCMFISSTSEIVTKLQTYDPTSLLVAGCLSPSGIGAFTRSYGGLIAEGNGGTDIVATANLPAAAAAQNGRLIIEDNGTGDRNLIVYAGGQRFRIDGGANV
jgi:hypothetical protein